MNIDQKEKRLMEAFASYESGESLATLQTVFPDVAVELDQMVEAERMLKEGKLAMRPSQELGRKVVAALNEHQRQNRASVFMSGFWRLAAPVGIVALSFMFVITNQHVVSLESTVDSDANLFAVQEPAPMMAKNAAVPPLQEASLAQSNEGGSLMLVPPEQSGVEAVEPSAADSFTLMADNSAADVPEEGTSTDTLYVWQMIALGLLALLSMLALVKHLRIRAATRAL